jgi:hypothetical protein
MKTKGAVLLPVADFLPVAADFLAQPKRYQLPFESLSVLYQIFERF